jgi:competence protein ComEC
VDVGWRLALLMLAWLAGAGVQLQQAALWPLARYEQIAVCGALALVAGVVARRRAWPLAVAGLFALGFAAPGWRATITLADALPPALEGRTVFATGTIASLPERVADGVRFAFEVESAALPTGEPVQLPRQAALGWYHRDDGAAAPTDLDHLRAGQRWRLPLRLKRPHGAMNPGGFDQELRWFEQGVRATGYVHEGADERPLFLGEGAGHTVDRWRQRIRDALYARVTDPAAAGVLAALAVGDQGAIERDEWQAFRAAGVAHLVSISGLHVTMLAWLASLGLGWLWRRSHALMLLCPAPLAARWGGLILGAAYAVLAGWGVPAQRTVCMLAVTTGITALGVRWPWPLVLLSAAATVVLIDPWALLQAGFWLSFAAVGLLMSSSPVTAEPAVRAEPAAGWRGLPARLRAHLHEGLRTQAMATLGLAPLTLVCFQQFSVIGFAANIVSIPLVTLVITPLALLGVAVPPLWSGGAVLVRAWIAALDWGAAWPHAVLTVPAAPAWAAALGLLAGALVMLPLPRRLRVLALPMALPLLWPAPPRPAPGQFELLGADIGQGTAVLVRTHEHLLLFDTGPQYSPESDAGDRVLLPLLAYRGEGPLDLLMLSHSDLDHVGGAGAVLGHWPVRLMSSSLPADHPLLRRGVLHRPCSAGQQWRWDGVRFEVLNPRAEALHWAPDAKPPKPNHLSCVLHVVDAQGHGALLTGDAEAPQEAQMIAAGAEHLKSDVLVVPHHGSRTSSSEAFLDAVGPQVALVQAGYRNRFGHPAPDVVARYEARGITLLRTDRCGAWTWSAAQGGRCERDLRRRYWQFTP